MLAWLPDEAFDQAIEHVKRYTPLTMTRRKDIERDLEETRERGYAINRGEFRAGVCGIAAPVRDRGGDVVAAIGVWGAEKAILGSRRDELAHMTVAAARDISREMGFVEVAKATASTRGTLVAADAWRLVFLRVVSPGSEPPSAVRSPRAVAAMPRRSARDGGARSSRR